MDGCNTVLNQALASPAIRSLFLGIYTKRNRAIEAKIFLSGNSQAVQIPKEFRFDTSVVEIFKRGDELVLKPKAENLGVVFGLFTQMPSDFMIEGRADDEPQTRDTF